MPSKSRMLLSICIPTYNRCVNLDHTLSSLVSQVDGNMRSKVEIIVADNFSTDDTQSVAQKYFDYPFFRYSKNSTNIGFDRNCDVAIRLATGVFVWLMSDDDFLEPTAVSIIYSLLDNNKDVVFAFVNYSVVEGGRVQSSACNITDIVRVPGAELVPRTRFAFSFVSSCIFRRECWLSLDPSHYFGTGWIHLFMARDILVRGESLIVGQRLIRMNGLDLLASRREKRTEMYPIEFYIDAHLKFLGFVSSLEGAGYPDEVVKQAMRISWINNFRQILYYKATADRYLINELTYIAKQMSIHFGDRAAFWVVHVPILFLPNSWVSRAYFGLRPIYKNLKRLVQSKT